MTTSGHEPPADPAENDAWLARAAALHAAGGPLDLHVDSIIQNRLFGYDVRKRHGAGLPGQPLFWHADVPRMTDAGYFGACMGIHYWQRETEKAWAGMHAQIDYLDSFAESDPATVRVRDAADWSRAHGAGKLAIAPGVEGAHMLNGRVDRVAELAERGVAYLTLTHFCANFAATPSMGRGANETDRLSDHGVALVQALNAYGVAVDLAHVNMPGALHACEVASAPMLVTHTGVKGVHDVARNVSDALIDAVAARDGAIGIMFGAHFLKGRWRVTSAAIADHLEYLVERVGVRHACLGSDYDGWLPAIPSDHRDCRDIVRVTAELLRRGWSDEDVEAVLWRNAVRVLVAAKEAATEGPSAR